MRIITPELNTIRIGHQGENGAVCVQINAADWPTLYGAGEFRLDHQRPSDPAGYPCEVSFDGQVVSWIVTASDVAIAGYGKAELVYKVNDVVAKSITYSTIIEASMDGSGDPPEPWESWVDEVLEARDEAVQAASDAHDDAVAAHDDAVAAAGSAGAAHDDAVAAHTDAQSAETDALKAEGYAVGEQNGTPVTSGSPYYQNNAKYYKEQAAAELANKADKVVGAVAGNLAMLDATGNLADSGISADLDETVSGSVIEFNSDESVPLKGALIKGKTAVLNQLANPTNGATTDLSFTVSDGVLTINGTTVNANYKTISASGYKTIIGHKYYVGADHTLSADEGLYVYNDGGGIVCGYNSKEIIGTATAEKPFYIVFASGKTFSNTTLRVMIIDLTACGFTSDETASVDALKAAWLSKFGYPLPQYIPYNAGSIVSNNAVYQLTGKNLLTNGTDTTNGYVSGYYLKNDGTTAAAAGYNISEYIRVAPNTGYVMSCSGSANAPSVCAYDASHNFIAGYNYGGTNKIIFTTPDNAAYVRASIDTSGTNQFEKGSAATTYEPYFNGGSITADSLNGFEGTDIYDTQSFTEKRRMCGKDDLGTLTWEYIAGATNARFKATPSTSPKIPASSTTTPNALCAKYGTSNYAEIYGGEDKAVGIGADGNIYIRDTAYTDAATFKTAMSGVYLVYELAAETTDTTTPAILTTQKGYNLLRTVSGDIQSAPATLTLWKGLGAIIAKVLSDLGVI